MTRRTLGLTFEDLDALKKIVEAQPRTHTQAATIVGYNRARLSRLVQRVNEHIGEKLDWRHNGSFAPPTEARRLVAAFTQFKASLSDVIGSPRVSVGSSSSLLLARFLCEQRRTLPRLTVVVRSREIITALENDEIDIAFVHSQSVDFEPTQEKGSLTANIEAVRILDWEARLIRPSDTESRRVEARPELQWEPHSTGEHLTQNAGHPSSGQTLFRIQCSSFLQAIELVRRGLVSHAVVPNIYLRESEPDLIDSEPLRPIQCSLVAVYRCQDQGRWEWLLDRKSWRRVVPAAKS